MEATKTFLYADGEARSLYEKGLLTLCEAQAADETIEPNKSVRDCMCAYGAETGRHFSQVQRDVLRQTRMSVETLQNLIRMEGSMDLQEDAILGSVDLNLYNALNNPVGLAPTAICKAIYCLGRLAERMDGFAGDIPGRRCKNTKFRNEYRQYREVARELSQNLEALLGFR